MSLLPLIISHDRREFKNNQSLENSLGSRDSIEKLPILANLPSDFYKFPDAQKDEQITGHIKENHFEILMDVHQFRPNEILVKTDKVNEKLFVTVEAKHNEEHISQEFVRKCSLPKSCDDKNVMATLFSDGVLAVEAPLAAI